MDEAPNAADKTGNLSAEIAWLKSELNKEKVSTSTANTELESSASEHAKLSTQPKELEENLIDIQEQHAAKSKQLDKIISLIPKEEDVI